MIIENKFNISKIEMKEQTKNFCPIGRDWYTNNFTISIIPSDIIPDYIDVDLFCSQIINNKEMIIEDAVNQIFEYCRTKFNPKSIKVESHVSDATHCEVTVYKEL